MHIPKEDRRKWDPKSKKCIFIGYSLTSKGYRLYDLKQKKVHESRDVIFVENEFGDRVKAKKPDEQQTEAPVIDDREPETDDETVPDTQIDPGVNENAIQEAENELILRRSNRIRKAPERDGYLTGDWWEVEDLLHVNSDENREEPRTIQQALDAPVKKKWKTALESEYSSLMKNEAWDLVELPQGRKPIGCRWVFKVKHHADGSIERYKARLVAKGYSREAGID